MKKKIEFLGLIITIICFATIYITNFVHFLIALSNEDWNLAIIKAIGVFTLLGSYITVWF